MSLLLVLGMCVPVTAEAAPGGQSAAAPGKKDLQNQRGVKHQVRKGDTLWNISRLYGVPMDSVAKANGIGGDSHIALGQVLFIPGGIMSFSPPGKEQNPSTASAKATAVPPSGADPSTMKPSAPSQAATSPKAKAPTQEHTASETGKPSSRSIAPAGHQTSPQTKGNSTAAKGNTIQPHPSQKNPAEQGKTAKAQSTAVAGPAPSQALRPPQTTPTSAAGTSSGGTAAAPLKKTEATIQGRIPSAPARSASTPATQKKSSAPSGRTSAGAMPPKAAANPPAAQKAAPASLKLKADDAGKAESYVDDDPGPTSGTTATGYLPLDESASHQYVPPPPSRDKPLAWPVRGVIYAKFGKRAESVHDGIDIAAPEATPIRAAGKGVVIFSAPQPGYGNLVIIQHPGNILTLYAQNRENLVMEGEKVKAGQVIARMGTGTATSGPYLHFEVRKNGEPQNPLKFLPPPR